MSEHPTSGWTLMLSLLINDFGCEVRSTLLCRPGLRVIGCKSLRLASFRIR